MVIVAAGGSDGEVSVVRLTACTRYFKVAKIATFCVIPLWRSSCEPSRAELRTMGISRDVPEQHFGISRGFSGVNFGHNPRSGWVGVESL